MWKSRVWGSFPNVIYQIIDKLHKSYLCHTHFKLSETTMMDWAKHLSRLGAKEFGESKVGQNISKTVGQPQCWPTTLFTSYLLHVGILGAVTPKSPLEQCTCTINYILWANLFTTVQFSFIIFLVKECISLMDHGISPYEGDICHQVPKSHSHLPLCLLKNSHGLAAMSFTLRKKPVISQFD